MIDLGIEFLRPWWLLGLLPWVFAAFYVASRVKGHSGWEHVVDAELQPYVIEPGESKRSLNKWLVLLGWLICLITLAGPVWDKQDLPVFQGQQAQVVLFDLSRSMLVDDVKPSRIVRARFKLTDFLKNASGVQIALVAFAERPYVVSPLSDDSNTIAAFVESLDPSIIPAQGSRIDLAIDQGTALLDQAGVEQGQLILITDSEVRAKDIAAAANANAAGHLVSVIGVGTRKGAPLRGEDGQFLKDANGAIVVPNLQVDGLVALAREGGGAYSLMTSNDNDLKKIAETQKALSMLIDESEQQTTDAYWLEYGPYLVLVLGLLSLLMFRKGVV